MGRCWLVVLAALALLTACAPLQPEEEAAARAVFADVKAGRFDAVEARLAPDLDRAQARAGMEQIRALIPDGPAREVKRTAYNVRSFAGTNGTRRDVYVQHFHDYGAITLVADTSLVYLDGAAEPQIASFQVNTVDSAAAAEGATFSLAGKTLHQYAFLACAVASPLLMLWGAFAAGFTKGFKRKWLWIIVSFVGLTKLAMNWTTGQVGFNLLNLVLLGFGVTRGASPLDPWIISFTLPFGALLVLLLTRIHRSDRRDAENADAVEKF